MPANKERRRGDRMVLAEEKRLVTVEEIVPLPNEFLENLLAVRDRDGNVWLIQRNTDDPEAVQDLKAVKPGTELLMHRQRVAYLVEETVAYPIQTDPSRK